MVTVKLVAVFKSIVGKEEITFPLEKEVALNEFIELLETHIPAFKNVLHFQGLIITLNREIAMYGSSLVKDGDEVALQPPLDEITLQPSLNELIFKIEDASQGSLASMLKLLLKLESTVGTAAFSQIKFPRAVERLLCELEKTEYADDTASKVWMLGKFGDIRAKQIVISWASHSLGSVHCVSKAAQESLGQHFRLMSPKEQAQYFLDYIECIDKIKNIEGLKYATKQATRYLIECLDSKDPYEKIFGAEKLGNLRINEALPKLRKLGALFRLEKPEVKRAAKKAISEIKAP